MLIEVVFTIKQFSFSIYTLLSLQLYLQKLILEAITSLIHCKCVSETFKRIIKPFAALFTEDTFNSLN